MRRPITSYSKVRHLVSWIIRNRPFHIPRNVTSKEYLDMGCGPQTHPDFINLDYGWHPGIDICWDITKGIPLRDGLLRGIFTEHCLEHLPLQSLPLVLKECWRVLAPDGTLRVIVPDGELYLTTYSDIAHGASARLPYADRDAFDGVYSPIMSVNRIFRDHGHQFIYDFDTLRQFMEQAGFTRIKKEAFLCGRQPRVLLDTESRAHESLRVEASKPARK